MAAVDAQWRDETASTDVVSVADYLLCRQYARGVTRAPAMGRLAYMDRYAVARVLGVPLEDEEGEEDTACVGRSPASAGP
jgi:hypothetical protein